MNDLTKIGASHLSRAAYVYLRQSTAAQVEHNRESTQRQYALAARATALGWPAQQVVVIDEDLGLSGSGIVERSGFARLTAEVALRHVGIVLGLEVSRLARNNADWYRLLDLCGLTDTLIGDADGVYHPAMFNDRLLLGLKGTMSEAELHVLRARLLGGIRNKAARGELRRGLPVGFLWGEEDGEVRFHPDEAVCGAIRTVFARFAELGSVRRVWLWLRTEGLSFPMQTRYGGGVRWVDPSYIAVYHVLTNPVYAGAYAYGKSRHEVTLDASGARKKRVRKLPRSQWSVLLPNHHEGFIDWSTYESNRARITANTHPRPHQSGGGAVREGSALLQGLAVCGQCGRKLRTHYTGRTASAGYHCAGKSIVDGRGIYCLSVGAVQIDEAVAHAVLAALAPCGVEAALAAAERIEADHDGALAQWRLAVERTSYEAQRAERRYRAVDPDNRLVARGLEAEWENCLRELEKAKAELARREQLRPRTLSAHERIRLLALGSRSAQGLAGADHVAARQEGAAAHAARRGHHRRPQGRTPRAPHAALARRCSHRERPRFAAARVRQSCAPMRTRSRWCDAWPLIIPTQSSPASSIVRSAGAPTGIASPPILSAIYVDIGTSPVSSVQTNPPEGELLTIKQTAVALGVATSTIHRWLNDGIIAGEQLTPRCAVAHSPHRRLARPCRGRSSRRLPHHVPDHALAGRFPANRVAACQARRHRGRPCPARA